MIKRFISALILVLLTTTIAVGASSRIEPDAYIVKTYAASSADYDTLDTWEEACDIDLTALTTLNGDPGGIGATSFVFVDATPMEDGKGWEVGDTFTLDPSGGNEETLTVLSRSTNTITTAACAIDHATGETVAAGMVLECAAGTYATDWTLLDGATDSTSFYRVLRPDADGFHYGNPNKGVRFVGTADPSGFIWIDEDYASVQDIVAAGRHDNADFYRTFEIRGTSDADGASYIGCISYGSENVGSGAISGFGMYSTNSGYFINCMAVEDESVGFVNYHAGNNGYYYNCSAIEPGVHGFWNVAGTMTATNCLGFSAGTNDFNGTIAQTYCASSDATASGTGSNASVTIEFVRPFYDKYHINCSEVGDGEIVGEGLDLSTVAMPPAGSATGFTDDIDRQTKVTNDIGADDHIHGDTTYYIDGTGSGENYYATFAAFQDAGVHLIGGDTVAFERGDTFTEDFIPAENDSTGLGTDAYITYTAFGTGDRPVLDAEDTRDSGIKAYKLAYVIFEYLQAENAYEDGTPSGGDFGSGVKIELSLDINLYMIKSDSNENSGVRILNSNNTKVEFCELSNNSWDGVSYAGTCAVGEVFGNLIHDNGTPGAYNGSGDAMTAHDDTTDIRFQYNLCYDNVASGVAVIDSSTGIVYGNVFARNGTANFTKAGFWAAFTTATFDWTVKNNIFMDNFPGELVFGNSTDHGRTTLDSDLYYDADDTDFFADNWDTLPLVFDTWTTYHTTNGNEVNSNFANPLFLDASTDDFRLSGGSPAIGKGEDLGASLDDILDPTDIILPYTVVSQDDYGSGWEIGAWAFINEINESFEGVGYEENWTEVGL